MLIFENFRMEVRGVGRARRRAGGVGGAAAVVALRTDFLRSTWEEISGKEGPRRTAPPQLPHQISLALEAARILSHPGCEGKCP